MSVGSQVFLFFGLVLAVVSLSRLLVVDEFPPTRAVHDAFIRWFAAVDADGNLIKDVPRWGRLAWLAYPFAYVWTCMWCMSFWAGLAVWAVADWATPLSVPYPWLMIATARLAAGILSMVESAHNQRYELRDRELHPPRRPM